MTLHLQALSPRPDNVLSNDRKVCIEEVKLLHMARNCCLATQAISIKFDRASQNAQFNMNEKKFFSEF
jgi:hypothetical protein